MLHHITPFHAYQDADGRNLILARPWDVAYMYRGQARIRRLRAGFRWNGCSVPPALRWWLHPHDDWTRPASCLHDHAYAHADIGRREADWLFRLALYREAYERYPVLARRGLRRWWQRMRLSRRLRQARIMHRAVRAFGAVFWDAKN
jgi:hypothetical protein